MHAMLVDLLEKAVASGAASITDCTYVADALLGTLDVDLYLFQRHERGYTPAQIIDGLHGLVDGLRRMTAVEPPLPRRMAAQSRKEGDSG
jgi:hypothetical protein